jgi:hypothetical protein
MECTAVYWHCLILSAAAHLEEEDVSTLHDWVHDLRSTQVLTLSATHYLTAGATQKTTTASGQHDTAQDLSDEYSSGLAVKSFDAVIMMLFVWQWHQQIASMACVQMMHLGDGACLV